MLKSLLGQILEPPSMYRVSVSQQAYSAVSARLWAAPAEDVSTWPAEEPRGFPIYLTSDGATTILCRLFLSGPANFVVCLSSELDSDFSDSPIYHFYHGAIPRSGSYLLHGLYR